MSESLKPLSSPEADRVAFTLFYTGLVDSLSYDDEQKATMRALMRQEAINRINAALMVNEEESIFFSLVDDILVTVYGGDAETVTNMSEIVKQPLVRALLARDLLYREFYEENGERSLYAERYYPDHDPEDFDAYGTSWAAIRQEVKRANTLKSSSKVESTVYSVDPMENYAYLFGDENVIVLPFHLEVGQIGVTMTHVTDFQAPYGGENAERTVYFRRKDELLGMPVVPKKK